MEVDATDADCLGNEPVYCNDRLVGITTGGAYGFAVRKSLAFAYLEPAFAGAGRELAITIRGEKRAARTIAQPAWDPHNERLRA
jgi:dimethylglycine dehydrogenase